MLKRVGVDIGFIDCKAVADGGTTVDVFPSVLGLAESSAKVGVGLGRRRTRAQRIEYEGRTYFLGEDALTESRMTANRQDAGRIGSVEERVLMLASLARLNVDEALIVTGLPVMWWDHRRLLVRSWVGRHEIAWNGKLRTIIVHEVRPVWQPFGSFYARFLDQEGRATADDATMMAGFGVVDVGGNTTDLSGIVKLRPFSKWSRGVQLGVGNALEAVSADLEARYGVHRPVAELSVAMRNGGTIAIYRETVDLRPLVEAQMQALADEVVSVSSRLWGQADRFHTVLVSGGGAALMGKALVRAFPRNAEVLPNPGLANALGFARFAQRRIFKADRAG